MKALKISFMFIALHSTFLYGLTKKELAEKYKLREEINWEERLGTTLAPLEKDFLAKGLYQEAVWILEEKEEASVAGKIKAFLDEIMREGEIPDDAIANLGGGVTETKLVFLPYGVRGVFKAKSRHPSSNYKSEVGAYIIDQMGKFAMVPMTVLRRVNGVEGSFQYFIKDAKEAREVTGYKKSANLNVFDYIIKSYDRTGKNIVIANNKEIAIDHGLALRPGSWLGKWLTFVDKSRNALHIKKDMIRQIKPTLHAERDLFRTDARILKALRTFSEPKLKQHLYPLLDDKAITMVWKKTQKVLAFVDPKLEKMFQDK